MEVVEGDVGKLLRGEVLPVEHVESYTSDQPPLKTFLPICKRTVTYIVMAVLFDDRGRVALIQEAKQSCHGKWYLPAGRVEPGENLIVAIKREVLEEAGLDFEPCTLLGFTMSRIVWHRFLYLGTAIGGKLKTLAEQDSESLQANWFTLEQIRNGFVPLRYKDILPALDLAEKYRGKSAEMRHPVSSIVVQPHRYLVHRLLIFQQPEDRKIEVLCYKKDGYRIPCCYICPGGFSIKGSVQYLAEHVFHSTRLLSLLGIVSIEHCGIPAREHDGMCVTTAVLAEPHKSSGDPNKASDGRCTPQNKDYHWISIGGADLLNEIQRRIFQDNLLIPLDFY